MGTVGKIGPIATERTLRRDRESVSAAKSSRWVIAAPGEGKGHEPALKLLGIAAGGSRPLNSHGIRTQQRHACISKLIVFYTPYRLLSSDTADFIAKRHPAYMP